MKTILGVILFAMALASSGELPSKASIDKAVEKLVQKDPESHSARVVAAFFYFNGGYFPAAEVHFKKAAELAPDDPYDQAWLYMAQFRQKPSAPTAEIEAFLAKHKSGEFIDTNIELLLRKISPEDAIKKALDSKDEGNLCEAYFYAAQVFLVDGEKDKAKVCFKKSIKTQKTTFWEYKAAAAGLETLD